MELDQALMTENILNLALEIIQLLIGEDYIIMKKHNGHETNVTRAFVSEGSSSTKDPIVESDCRLPVDIRKNDEKILELANKIIHLLTGLIPVKEDDVAVYFTLEEWDYLVQHQDLYKDLVNRSLGSESELKNRDRKAGSPKPDLVSNGLIKGKSNNEIDLEIKGLRTHVSNDAEPQSESSMEEDCANHTDDDYLSGYVDEGPLIVDPNTPLEHVSTHMCEQTAPWHEQNLPEINIYIPTDHVVTGYTPYIKNEASLSTEGNDYSARVLKQECSEDGATQPAKLSETCFISVKKEPDLWREDPALPTNELREGRKKKVDNKSPSLTGRVTFTNHYGQCDPRENAADTSEEHNVKLEFNQDSYAKLVNNLSVIKCNDCGRSFNSKSAFTNHQRSKTTGRMYNCSDYQKHCISSPELLKQLPFNGEINPLPCPECGKYFYSKSLLTQHQWDHFNGKKFSCAECGKRCFSETELEAHQKNHAMENKLVCPDCGRTFSRKADLIRHYKAQTDGRHTFDKDADHGKEKPMESSWSAQSESQRSQFAERMGLTLSSGNKYICSECGKCFSEEAYLLIHQRRHVGKKPFPCFECGKCFTSKSYLSIHQKVHFGSKPFSCSQCGKSFMSHSHFIKHCNTHSK